jgi:hypothetical protein
MRDAAEAAPANVDDAEDLPAMPRGTPVFQTLYEEDVHADEQQNEEDDGEFGEAQERFVGFVVLVVIHCRMAVRRINAHFCLPLISF